MFESVDTRTHGRTDAGSSPILRGSSNKELDFCYSAVNLHARLTKVRSKLARLLGYSYELYSTCYIVQIFVARQHKKTGRTRVDSSL